MERELHETIDARDEAMVREEYHHHVRVRLVLVAVSAMCARKYPTVTEEMHRHYAELAMCTRYKLLHDATHAFLVTQVKSQSVQVRHMFMDILHIVEALDYALEVDVCGVWIEHM
jgi:hypothetical protein